MRPFKIIFFIILLLVNSACEKPIKFNFSGDSVIVVNSLISANEPIQIKLSRSIGINIKDTVEYIDNASVGIYCDNVLKEEIACTGNGLYKSTLIAETGKEYKIIVSSPRYASVTANTIVPPKPEIVDIIGDISMHNGYDIRVRITLKDNAYIKNYYLLTMKGYFPIYGIDPVTNKYTAIGDSLSNLPFVNNDYLIEGNNNSTATETLDAILGTADVGNHVIYWIAFSDQSINGTQHTIETYIINNIKPSYEKPLYVELKSINEDYYNYLKSKYYAQNSKTNPFSEPIKVYNNIVGGAGIFAAYNLVSDSITTIVGN
jgi:hypothetical protein